MTNRILRILDNVRYWDTCPEDYKKDIETFLEGQKQALRIPDVVGRSEQLKTFNCINLVDGFEPCKEQCLYCRNVKGF